MQVTKTTFHTSLFARWRLMKNQKEFTTSLGLMMKSTYPTTKLSPLMITLIPGNLMTEITLIPGNLITEITMTPGNLMTEKTLVMVLEYLVVINQQMMIKTETVKQLKKIQIWDS